MASCSPHLQKFLLNKICGNYGSSQGSSRSSGGGGGVKSGEGRRLCSAIAIDAPASIASVSGIRWGTVQLKGAREEMEDDAVIIQSDDLDGFSFAAVFDGHAGFSSVQFLREELYRECYAALQGKNLLGGKDFKAVKKALEEAFKTADAKLLKWLEEREVEDESGATATVLFLRDDTLFVAHVGDSCLALSRSGNAEVLTESHRPYGNKQVSLQEIRRIREAGGWINNGRICGDISVSRAFGDIRFKSKKYEMLRKGVEEGTWTKKFASRIKFTGDLVTATPDVFQAALGSDAEFIVLASDGLWDYMSSSDVVNFIRSQLRKHGDVQLASEALAQVALDRRSADNISIIIADLRRTDWQNVAVQKQNIVLELAQAGATISLVTLGIWMTTLLSS